MEMEQNINYNIQTLLFNVYYNVLHVNSHAMEKVEKSGIKDSVCVSVYVCNIFR